MLRRWGARTRGCDGFFLKRAQGYGWRPGLSTRILDLGKIRPGWTKPKGSSPLQRLVEVGGEVLDRLDPDREPQQSVEEPHRAPRFGRHRGMRHRGRVADQALDAAQALGPGEQTEAVEHPASRLQR